MVEVQSERPFILVGIPVGNANPDALLKCGRPKIEIGRQLKKERARREDAGHALNRSISEQ